MATYIAIFTQLSNSGFIKGYIEHSLKWSLYFWIIIMEDFIV